MKLILLSLLFTSCASILNDKTQNINIMTSNNTKTKITINSQEFTAPGIIQLYRSENDLIISVDESKCTQQYLLKSEVDNKFWINVLTGGPFGSSTDYGTDKMWRYQDQVVIPCS